MNNKWTNDLLKASFTFIFIIGSYFFASKYSIPISKNIIPQNMIFNVNVALYTSILNFLLFLFLSFRTVVSISAIDNKDKSSIIKLDKKPRKIAVKVEINGNTDNSKGKIIVNFPKWVDVTKTNDPDIKTMSQYKYSYDLKNNTKSFTFYFDINLNTQYEESTRNSEIEVFFKGNRIRYSKNTKNLKIHNE